MTIKYTEEFNRATERSGFEGNSLLWSWLRSDVHRAALFSDLRENLPVLKFSTRDIRPIEDENGNVVDAHRDAYILTRKEDISYALKEFSNKGYKPLGSGTFVLASDNTQSDGHSNKRKFLLQALKNVQDDVSFIAQQAIAQALIGPTKNSQFNLVRDVAEQTALRFSAAIFGIPDKEHVFFMKTMRPALDALVYQMYARHFISNSVVLPKGNGAMAKLAVLVEKTLQEKVDSELLNRFTDYYCEDVASAGESLSGVISHILTVESIKAEEGGNLESEGNSLLEAIANGETPVTEIFKFLDESLNLYQVRNEFRAENLINLNLGVEMSLELEEFFQAMIDEKERPDDSVIPIRLNADSESPHPLPVLVRDRRDFNLRFRKTVLDYMIEEPSLKSGEYSATGGEIVRDIVGSLSGLVGNITAGISIVMNQLLENHSLRLLAEQADDDELTSIIKESLRLNPPAAFIPRVASSPTGNHKLSKKQRTFVLPDKSKVEIPEGADVMIPLGAASRDLSPDENPDEFNHHRTLDAYNFIFGDSIDDSSSHRCIGEGMSIPLIVSAVRKILDLQGLSLQSSADGLSKKWGYICDELPVVYSRDQVITQKPLNVIMKVKTPVAKHAEVLKQVINYGAPIIERLLAASGIVHFARFVFLNDDKELGLFTTYDGDFDTYIALFADVAGPMFDLIFEHMEVAPPMPVREHRSEFVDLIRQYDRAPVSDYFFSAYPSRSVESIRAAERSK